MNGESDRSPLVAEDEVSIRPRLSEGPLHPCVCVQLGPPGDRATGDAAEA